jgi:Flp pilus assembly protein TadG
MIRHRVLRALRGDDRAAATVEFAILTPVIFGLMLGVMQLGLHMHNYNAVRSVATDTARYVIVEYQKNNLITDSEIQTKAVAIGITAPYLLDSENLDVVVSRPATDIVGTTKMQVQISYTPTSLLGVLKIGSPTITVTRPIYVD